MERSKVEQDSVKEGNRLAHMYDNATDLNAVDKQVHDALLQDAIKAHHSELNLKTVRETFCAEANKSRNPNVIIKNSEYTTSRNWTLPVVNWEMDGTPVYDILDASKVIAQDDARREQEKAKKEDEHAAILNWNPFDGSFGIGTAFGTLKPEKH